jgi:hypothetical protein
MLRTKLQKKTESSNSETSFFDNLFTIALRDLSCSVASCEAFVVLNCYVVEL